MNFSNFFKNGEFSPKNKKSVKMFQIWKPKYLVILPYFWLHMKNQTQKLGDFLTSGDWNPEK
jgi:hypothetical protein